MELWYIIILLVVILIIRLYCVYAPHIDYVINEDKHLVLLYYNNYTDNGVERQYIKLLEIWV